MKALKRFQVFKNTAIELGFHSFYEVSEEEKDLSEANFFIIPSIVFMYDRSRDENVCGKDKITTQRVIVLFFLFWGAGVCLERTKFLSENKLKNIKNGKSAKR